MVVVGATSSPARGGTREPNPVIEACGTRVPFGRIGQAPEVEVGDAEVPLCLLLRG